jgi:hypothetical protein
MSKVLLEATARDSGSGLPAHMPDHTIVSATMNLAKDPHGIPPSRVLVVHGARNDFDIDSLTDETRIGVPSDRHAMPDAMPMESEGMVGWRTAPAEAHFPCVLPKSGAGVESAVHLRWYVDCGWVSTSDRVQDTAIPVSI